MHISLPETLQLKLAEYVSTRKDKRAKSKTIHRALDLFFRVEAGSELGEAGLEHAITSQLALPPLVPARSAYLILYMLANNYPNQSAKKFWTEAIYISPTDKTHKELYEDIRAEFYRFSKKASNKESK